MPLLARLFRGKREAHAAEEEIVLADFNLRPATTIDVTPGAAEPPLATVVAESARPAGQSELNSVVRDMQGMLAADHASMEVATAEMRRMTEELERVSAELTQIRRRLDAQSEVLRALHSTTEAQAARVRETVAAVRKFGESLVD